MDYLGLLEAITDSAIVLDKSGRILHWNNSATTLFGYAKKEVLHRSINFIYDRNYPFPKLIQEQKRWQEETIYIRKNGMKGFCRSNLCLLPASDQHKVLALLTHHNVTDYKRVEEDLQKSQHALEQRLEVLLKDFGVTNTLLVNTLHQLEESDRKLRESNTHFDLIAENATDIISRHTADGVFLYVSPASHASLGYLPEELMGKSVYRLMHPEDLQKIKKALTRKRDTISNKPIVYRLKQKEGEFRWFESNIRLILDDKRRHIREIQLASRDITDRVIDKKARLRGQQLAHVFRLSTMEEMASGIAHEMSQPLTAIVHYTRGCVRHLQNGKYDQEQLIHIMEKAAIQAERAGETVQRLKNFFCKGQLVKTSCKLNHVIRETVSLIKPELTESKTKVELEYDKALPTIFIDKIQIQQVILNLIQNAIESMKMHHVKDKRLHIHAKTTATTVDVIVSDTGPGFSKENIYKVFMPFFTTKTHGRGMGLAICRSIIEAHGGQFTINPNTYNQSWIRFSIPISI